MKAVYYAGHGRIDLRDCPAPTPATGEVLLRMRSSAICGSELHDYRGPHESRA